MLPQASGIHIPKSTLPRRSVHLSRQVRMEIEPGDQSRKQGSVTIQVIATALCFVFIRGSFWIEDSKPELSPRVS